MWDQLQAWSQYLLNQPSSDLADAPAEALLNHHLCTRDGVEMCALHLHWGVFRAQARCMQESLTENRVS